MNYIYIYCIYTHYILRDPLVSHEAFWANIRARQLCISGSAPALQATSRAAGLGQKNRNKKRIQNDSWWSFVDDFYLKIKETMNESGYWKMSLIHGLNDDRHSGKHHCDVIRSRLAFRQSPRHGKSWGWLIVESFFKGTGSNRQNAVFSHTIICN